MFSQDEGELVEQVLGQQTAENGESILDNLIRQLQNHQDEHQNAEPQADEAEGMSCCSRYQYVVPVMKFNTSCNL